VSLAIRLRLEIVSSALPMVAYAPAGRSPRHVNLPRLDLLVSPQAVGDDRNHRVLVRRPLPDTRCLRRKAVDERFPGLMTAVACRLPTSCTPLIDLRPDSGNRKAWGYSTIRSIKVAAELPPVGRGGQPGPARHASDYIKPQAKDGTSVTGKSTARQQIPHSNRTPSRPARRTRQTG